MIHEAAARGFAQAVDAYERGRPGYPPEAVERLCEAVGIGPGRAVLDLAAGTGKLTRLLVPTGAELVAVEPVEQMRAALARALPEVTALAGTAEDVPLPDIAPRWRDRSRAEATTRRAGARQRVSVVGQPVEPRLHRH